MLNHNCWNFFFSLVQKKCYCNIPRYFTCRNMLYLYAYEFCNISNDASLRCMISFSVFSAVKLFITETIHLYAVLRHVWKLKEFFSYLAYIRVLNFGQISERKNVYSAHVWKSMVCIVDFQMHKRWRILFYFSINLENLIYDVCFSQQFIVLLIQASLLF